MILPETLDLSDKDFDALVARLDLLITSVFPRWSDRNTANFGNILKEEFAFVGGVVNYYVDSLGRESRWATVKQRKNAIALLKLIGYEMSSATPATADEQFTLSQIPIGDVNFPVGTIVKTEPVVDQLRFQLVTDVTISAGADPPVGTGTVEHSETVLEFFGGTGLADQEFMLDRSPYIDGSAVIEAANGTYQEVDNFLDSTGTDRHFVVLVDQNDRATIRFGDTVNGDPPTGSISSEYKIGGGSVGNVEADTLTVIEGSFTDSIGNVVQVSVTNPDEATPGTDRESIDLARVRAPESIRAINRTVSREDFEINAKRVDGVARALMLTSNELASIDENAGQLYIVPVGGGVPTTLLKDQVGLQLTVEQPHTLTFNLSIIDPIYLVVNVTAIVYLVSGAVEATVRIAIETSLANFFAISVNAEGEEDPSGVPNPLINFGYYIKDENGDPSPEVAWSKVYDAIGDSTGVRKMGDPPDGLLLNGVARDLTITLNEFPKLGTISLFNGGTGSPF